MTTELSTLHELCLQRIKELLKNSYWDPELSIDHNPFAMLPSSVIDTLITHFSETYAWKRSWQSSDLRLLLTSGRVRKFKLGHAGVGDESLQKVFRYLSSACLDLISVEIPSTPYRGILPRSRTALSNLLSKAQNVKHVKSSLEFNLLALSNSVQLEKLDLNFSLQNNIYDFLRMDGQMRPHTSLKHLEVSASKNRKIHYLDIAVVLKYCTELIFINCDISRALEHLHAEEIGKDNLTRKYKIRECYLGSPYGSCDDTASRDAVLLASLTCPDLTDVKLRVDDDDAISALGECQNLRILEITWRLRPYGGHTVGLRSLLEKPAVGCSLKSLKLSYVPNIDFSLIGTCCPNLEELKVAYINEGTRNEYSPTCFQKLRTLSLRKKCPTHIRHDTLVAILSNARNIKSVVMQSAEELTDFVVTEVLKKNNLSTLERFYVTRCGLSLSGWRNLARNAKAVENLFVDCMLYRNVEDASQPLNR